MYNFISSTDCPHRAGQSWSRESARWVERQCGLAGWGRHVCEYMYV